MGWSKNGFDIITFLPGQPVCRGGSGIRRSRVSRGIGYHPADQRRPRSRMALT